MIDLLNSLTLAAIMGLVAIGLAVIFGVRGVINFAHGELFMLGAYCIVFFSSRGLSTWFGVLLAPMFVGFVGLVLERFVVRRLYARPLDTLVATFGVSLILRELIKLTFGAGSRNVPLPMSGQMSVFGTAYPQYRIFLIVVSAIVLGLATWASLRTDAGVRVRAVIQNRQMAEAMGINSHRVDSGVFVIGAALAGLAGALMAPLITLNPEVGPTFLARSFLVVILGGVGSVLAAIGGAVVVGVGDGMLSVFVRPVYAQMLLFLLAIGVICLRPGGLFRRRGTLLTSPAPPAHVPHRLHPALATVLCVGGFVALWIAPFLVGGRTVSLLSRYLLFGLAAMSLDLLWGKAGLLSFGHAALFGLGCYGSGLILTHVDARWAPLVAVVVGMLVALTFATVLGGVLFSARVAGVYFGLVTLLIALLLEQLAGTWAGLTGGFNGMIVPTGFAMGPIQIESTNQMYYAILVVVTICVAAGAFLMRTPLGRAIDASRLNEQRAESLGYSTAKLRLVAISIAGALAGLAGAIYAPTEGFVYPSQFGLVLSTSMIIWVVIGGRGTVVGGVVGALVINMLQSRLSSQAQEYWPFVVGWILLAMVLAQPEGVIGVVRRVGGVRARP